MNPPMLCQQNLSVNLKDYINPDPNTICRLCLKKFGKEDFFNLFQPFDKSKPETVAEHITHFANIPISREDCFSKVICRRCVRRLCDAIAFKTVITGCNEFLVGLYESYNQVKDQTGSVNENISETVFIVLRPGEDNQIENGAETKREEEIPILNTEIEDTKIEFEEHDVKVEPNSELGEGSSKTVINVEEKVEPVVAYSGYKKKKRYKRNPNLRYPCSYCERIFKTKSARDAHQIEHTGNYYNCDICNKKFTSVYNYRRHKRIHNKDVVLECKKCQRQFWTLSSLHYHKEGHADTPKYQCDVCGDRFYHRKRLEEHKRNHEQLIEQKCEICHKTLRSHSLHAMKAHMRVHASNRERICPKCGKAFKSRDGYQTHLKIHNGELKFKCDLCPKAYASKKSLRDHTASVHSTVKPYSCEICGKLFALKTYLYIHGKVHAKDNPYPCTVCDKKFGYRDQLKGHLRYMHGVVQDE